MAPGYRANNQSRRQNRGGYVDHDVFEGLPVRNWRRDNVTVAPPPVHEVAAQKDKWDVELPWGMPKDSHLLPQHSQDLLRAARSGRLYVKRKAADEEDPEVDPAIAAEKQKEKDAAQHKEEGFSVKTWKVVPRHQEGPEIEYLAKRRKVIRGAAQNNVPSGPPLTKATVRRVDAAGNSYVEDLVVPEGQAVEGEVISQTVISDPSIAAAGDVVPTPPRRRPPPPKRKAKGPGRGRKKKLPLPPTSVPTEGGAVNGEGAVPGDGTANSAVGPDGEKLESSTTPANNNDDTEMGDDSQQASDEEGDEGEEGEEGEDGEEGDEDDEGEDQEGDREDTGEVEDEGEIQGEREITDEQEETLGTKMRTRESESLEADRIEGQYEEAGFGFEGAQDFRRQRLSEGAELDGSPLKQVMTQQPYPEEMGDQSQDFGTGNEDVDMDGGMGYHGHDDGTGGYANDQSGMAMQGSFQPIEGQTEFHTATGGMGHDYPHDDTAIPAISESDIMQPAIGTATDNGDEMLLDQVEGIPAIGDLPPHEEHITFDPVPSAVEDPTYHAAPPAPAEQQPAIPGLTELPQHQPPEEEDKFEDLLGSLEEHLDDATTTTAAPAAPESLPSEVPPATSEAAASTSAEVAALPTVDIPVAAEEELVPEPTSAPAPVAEIPDVPVPEPAQITEVAEDEVKTEPPLPPPAPLLEAVEAAVSSDLPPPPPPPPTTVPVGDVVEESAVALDETKVEAKVIAPEGQDPAQEPVKSEDKEEEKAKEDAPPPPPPPPPPVLVKEGEDA